MGSELSPSRAAGLHTGPRRHATDDGCPVGRALPKDGLVLVVGAGGGLEIRYLSGFAKNWRFVGVDPSASMLDVARATAGPVAGERLSLIEGRVEDAPDGPFDAATCILVMGLIPDDGSKLTTLKGVHQRLKPGAPFILVDQCIDRSAADFELRLSRYAAFALASRVELKTVDGARQTLAANSSIVSPQRNEDLLACAGFKRTEVFYVGMAWRGWLTYA